MAEEFFIPKLGQTVEEVTILGWKVEDGQRVEQGEPVLEVETDKAVFPVEANASGYIHLGPYKAGDVVPVLTVVAVIGKKDDKFEVKGAPAAQPEAEAAAAATPAEAAPAATAPEASATGKVFASPRARRLAAQEGVDLRLVTPTGGGGVRVAERDVLAYLSAMPKATPVAQKMAAEAGIDLRQVVGTGPGGKITREDVERAIQAAAPAVPAVPTPVAPSPAPAVPAVPTPVAPPSAPAAPAVPLSEVEVLERIPLKGVRAVIAQRMAASVHTTARVTLVSEVDATHFVEMRERLKQQVAEEWGFAPGYNDLLAKIVANALRKFPYMNARLTEDAIELLAHVNIGIAVDTERGLLVPVVRDVDRKSLRQFGEELRQLIERARAGRALPDDLTGGTFTITNLGPYDIDAFTPVINLPEAAILGVGRIAPKVVVRDGQMVIRQMVTLSLAFDHRLVDGAPAARFLQYIKQLVEEPYLLVTL
jgi:pyruvate dehydrogenase E2 component (dihydrolipoamide acetyltransferase)